VRFELGLVIGHQLHHSVMTELPLKVQEEFNEGKNNVISHRVFQEDRRLVYS